MASNDVEIVQSFIRKYINKAIKEHFKDIPGEDENSLSKAAPRSAIKLVCLHKDTDPITLTAIRLLIWWVEARGLMDEYIYGIPVSQFQETVQYLPQIKLFWREKTKAAELNNRYPARARYTIRFKGSYQSKADIKSLATKINNIFNKPSVHNFTKGREKYSYRDKEKGYEFIITAQNELEAKKVINALLEIQDDNPLKDEYLTKSTTERNWTERTRKTVAGETILSPKQRPIADVYFTHAEFSIHGMARDIRLVNNLGTSVSTRLI
jgi:hypothetical protein